jgi:hypothetical protein
MPSATRRPLQLDDKLVGITFIDVLFALVIGKLLEPFATAKSIPTAGMTHLLLAGVVTIGSWIGYHNSLSRPHYVIRFVNLPLAQFLIDVALVVVYWLLAITAEGTTPAIPRPVSAVPEARYVMIGFLLYSAWDLVALRIRQTEQATGATTTADVPARRRVTYVFSAVSAVTWALLWWTDPRSTSLVVLADAWLIAVAIAYRLGKEWVSSAKAVGRPTSRRARANPARRSRSTRP